MELLFPLTYPIQTVPNWTIDGIIAHGNSRPSMLLNTYFTRYAIGASVKSCGVPADHFGLSMTKVVQTYTDAVKMELAASWR